MPASGASPMTPTLTLTAGLSGGGDCATAAWPLAEVPPLLAAVVAGAEDASTLALFAATLAGAEAMLDAAGAPEPPQATRPRQVTRAPSARILHIDLLLLTGLRHSIRPYLRAN